MSTKQFTTSEIQGFIDSGKVIFFKFKSVFQLRQSSNVGFYFQPLPHKRDGNFTIRGRFHAVTQSDAEMILA